ncbi:hypothetical protein DFP72DRAFT_575585 [Ephemerocybe angulata]|uniref:Uncharacterized protein n=1 Tax=Ephemerocybe angulata TaxID=980116 RepID=A0A8H6HJY1_9AGAR|nr:hypothetical protein DFP72DRAFT_575585 [Tulosesus angulatus]
MSARKRTRSQSRDLSDGGGTEKRLCDDTRQGVHVGTSARRGLPTPPATSAQQELPTPPATSAQQGLPTPPATQRKGVQRRLQSSQMETPTRYSLRSSKTGSTSERTRLEPVLENPTMKTFTFRTPIKLREPIRKLDALEEDVEMDLEEQDMDVEEQETGEKRTRERVESPTRKRTENGRPSSDASTSSTAPAIAYPSPTRESTENALPSSGAATSSTVPAIVPHPIADCSLPSVGVDCHDHPVNQSSPPSRSPSMNVNTVRDAGFSSNPEDPLQFTTMGSTSIQDDIQVASATGSVTSMVSPLSSPGVHPHVAEKEDLADSPSTPSTSFHDSQILSASSSHGDVLSSQMLSASSSHTDVLSHSSSMSVETPLLDGPQPSKPSTSFHGGSQVVSTSSSRVDVVSRSSSLGEDPCMPEKEKPLSELPPDRSTSFSSGSQIMSASSSHADVLSHSSSMSVEPPLLDGPQPSKPSTSLHGGSQVVSTSSSRVDVVSRSSSLGEDLRMPKKEKPLPELSPSRSTSSSRADVLSHSSLMIVEQPLVDKPDLPQTPSPATRPTSFHGDSQVMNTSNRCTDVVSRSSSMGVDPSRSTSFFGGSQIISASSSRADVISHSSLMNVESPLLDGPNLPTHSPAARPTSFHNGSHPRSTSSRMGSVSFHDDSQIISASGTCDDVISHASSMGADSPLRGQTQPLTSSLLMELDALHDDQAVITPDYQLQTDAISYVSSMKIGPLSIEPQAEARSSDRKISSLSSMSAVLGGDNAAPADGSSSIEVTGILGHCRPDSPSAATQPHVPARRRLPSVFSEDSDDGSGRSARSAAQSDIVRNLWLDKDLLHLDRLPITTNTASVVVLSDLEDSDASSSMDIMSDQGSPVTRSSRRQSVISSALSSSMGILSDVEEKYASASTLEESSLVYSNSSSVSMQVLSDARPPSTGSSTANSCSTSSRAMLLDQDDFRTPGGAAILSHYSSDDMSLVSASRGITDGMSVAFDNSPSPSILSELYESDGSTAMDILSFQRSPLFISQPPFCALRHHGWHVGWLRQYALAFYSFRAV